MPEPPERKRRRSACPEEAAFLDLLRTTDMLSRRLAPVLKTADLSATQYNVLRILRGTPEGLACGEVANRMITRDPDITRLLDRLEKQGLISRCREAKDRRMVLTRITPMSINGESILTYDPDGLRYTLVAPLADIVSALCSVAFVEAEGY